MGVTMEQPTIEVNKKKFGMMAALLLATVLAVYVFDLPPAIGIIGQLGLLVLMLGGFGWHMGNTSHHRDQVN
jgi:hypothetical protein